jgi:iron complex transport system permease protein
VIVYSLGSLGREGATPVKLALAGAALTALLGSITRAILLMDVDSLDQFRFWAVGSLAGRTGTIAANVAPFVAVGLVMALACAPIMNGLALGDDVARGLGQRTGAVKTAAALAVVLLAGAAVAVAGPIVLVGLAVPHVARALVGRDYARVLPVSALLGAALVLAADVAGRRVMPPEEVPAGVMAALVGAPVFLHAVRRGVRPM